MAFRMELDWRRPHLFHLLLMSLLPCERHLYITFDIELFVAARILLRCSSVVVRIFGRRDCGIIFHELYDAYVRDSFSGCSANGMYFVKISRLAHASVSKKNILWFAITRIAGDEGHNHNPIHANCVHDGTTFPGRCAQLHNLCSRHATIQNIHAGVSNKNKVLFIRRSFTRKRYLIFRNFQLKFLFVTRSTHLSHATLLPWMLQATLPQLQKY